MPQKTAPPSPAIVSPQDAKRAAFRRGIRDSIPFLLVFLPFGMLFGIAGTAAGLDLAQVMGFSIFVVAGAAQFSALQLIQAHAPTFLVLAASLAVNLRMAMYSAALAPHLGRAAPGWKALIAYLMMDQNYALAQNRYDAAPAEPMPAKIAYYMGSAGILAPMWWIATLLGALFGQSLPSGLALDFAVPVTFLAMIAPALRSVPHLVAALVSCIAALLLGFAPLPPGTGVLFAALLAMAAGAGTETLIARRKIRNGTETDSEDR